MFSWKFAAYFQNTFSLEHLWTVASGIKTPKFGEVFQGVWKENINLKWVNDHSTKEVKSVFKTIEMTILTLNFPYISEICVEIKIKLNFYFHTSLWGTTKKSENEYLTFFFFSSGIGTGRVRLKRFNILFTIAHAHMFCDLNNHRIQGNSLGKKPFFYYYFCSVLLLHAFYLPFQFKFWKLCI